MKQIKIDKEFKALIPPLQESELAGLEASILAEGCRDPLCVWDNTLLDGHNRHELCTKHNKPFDTVQVQVSSRDEAKLWIIRNQFGRRNLTDAQRIDLALKMEPLLSNEAAKRMKAGKADPIQNSGKGAVDRQLAEAAGVSHDTIHKQRFVKDNDPEKYAELIKPGSDLSINRAYLDVSQPIRREAKLAEISKKGGASTMDGLKPAGILLCDPPWKYDSQATERRSIELQYPTLQIDEISALHVKIRRISLEDCLLFMWATSPKLAEAIIVMESWGFPYVTCAVWDKQIIGQGYYFRQRHELLLIGKRGDFPTPLPADRPDSIFSFRREEHSAKPEYVHELIEKWYPKVIKTELFARSKRSGWQAWGNEA